MPPSLLERAVPIRTFITYAQESEAHKASVLDLANKLRSWGIDAVVDQFEPHPDEGWPKWMERQFEEADRVVLVPSRTYRDRYYQEAGVGSGARFEGSILTTILLQSGVSFRKFAVACVQDGTAQYIPRLMVGCQRYNVYMDDGYEALYRWLTDQPAIVPEPLGELRILPPRANGTGSQAVAGNAQGRFGLLCKALAPIMAENKRIFEAFGPNSGAGHDQPLRFDLTVWYAQRKERILPNNTRIRELVAAHAASIPEEHKELFNRLLSHIDAFDVHVRHGGADYRDHQFPSEIEAVIAEHSR